MATLPHDQISGILVCLPVKDLLRFRCVSEPIHSLIDSLDFSKLHLSHSLKTNTNHTCIFLSGRRAMLQSLQSSIHPHRPQRFPQRNLPLLLSIVGSCNGLVALLYESHTIVLWNPFTNKFRKVRRSYEYRESVFPYDPKPNSVAHGFGYDPFTDDYKLFKSFERIVEVYRMKKDRWGKIKNVSPIYSETKISGAGILVGNALHWTTSKVRPLIEKKIVAFDLVNEEFHAVPLSFAAMATTSIWNVGNLGGCLCVADFFEHLGDKCADVWVMKEYGEVESWIKLFSLLPDILEANFRCTIVDPLASSGNKVLFDIYGKLFWYDTVKKTVEVFPHSPIVLTPWIAVESLVSPERPERIERRRV